jgi:hypothetical protein
MKEYATAPPRNLIHVETSVQAAENAIRQTKQTWLSWTKRQRIAVLMMLLQLIWPAYIYAEVTSLPYTSPSTPYIISVLAVALYLPAMAALGAAWLFVGPTNGSFRN